MTTQEYLEIMIILSPVMTWIERQHDMMTLTDSFLLLSEKEANRVNDFQNVNQAISNDVLIQKFQRTQCIFSLVSTLRSAKRADDPMGY